MKPLDGKVAIVTGASRGIGKGMALALAEQGATVYVTGRTVNVGDHELPGTVGETAAQCDARGGRGIAVQVDHGDDAQVAALFDQVRREQGRLDLLVNNAFAIPEDLTVPGSFWEKPLSNWDMVDVGVTYTYGVVFGTAKSAVDRMARDMAIELQPYGVASLALWQGLTMTERAQRNIAANPAMKALTVTNPLVGCSPEFPGRVIAALLADPAIMARSGGTFITAELAQDYGITDVDGKTIPSTSVMP